MKDLLSEIESYWTTRAEGYSEVNHKELNGMQKGAWLEVLKGQFPEKAKDEIKILDIGTGPGFFPVILAEAGYKVTAVDYTQEMLDTAKRNAGNLCERISFYKMDAQNLEIYAGQLQKYPGACILEHICGITETGIYQYDSDCFDRLSVRVLHGEAAGAQKEKGTASVVHAVLGKFPDPSVWLDHYSAEKRTFELCIDETWDH